MSIRKMEHLWEKKMWHKQTKKLQDEEKVQKNLKVQKKDQEVSQPNAKKMLKKWINQWSKKSQQNKISQWPKVC